MVSAEYLMSQGPHKGLFSLPEYEYAQYRFVCEGVARLMEAKDELWASLPKAEPVEAVPITHNTMPSGEVVQNEPVTVKAQFTYKYADIRSCNTEELAAQMDAAADQNLSVIMPHLFEIMRRTSEAAGTTSDAGGKPFSFELFLSGLAKIDISFDEKGKPELPTLVVGPELGKQIRAMPPLTPKQQKTMDDLIEKKRKEYNARRRDRKLR
jgi:hypothetical protein